ncbi:MAG: GNAT family N-acetyltransferase [Candidatus Limnocylindrales bacterium]
MTDVAIRPAAAADIQACAEIWRESINDYTGRLNQHPIPDDLGRIMRLHQHLFATDPDLFIVAEREGRVIAFAAGVRRERLWFLSMCFVRPAEQARGIGRLLLETIRPPADADVVMATAIDSAQPISNGLYSRFGIVPRMPLMSVSGYVTHPEVLPDLPPGTAAVPFETIASGPPSGAGHAELTTAINALDRELLGVEHPQDHRFLRLEGRHGYLYRDATGTTIGYGYAWETGRVGPVAVLDEAFLAPALAHLLRAVPSRGAQAVWVPGAAGSAVELLLGAGLRFEDFPILLSWSRPFADFGRYLPISPGLL